MVSELSNIEEIRLLASGGDWQWPEAQRDLFGPRGINFMVANSPREFVNIIEHTRVHAAIVDVDQSQSAARNLSTVRLIRMGSPLLPCIALSQKTSKDILASALRLDVFSVIQKPVPMEILREQLHRLFIKRYKMDVFAS